MPCHDHDDQEFWVKQESEQAKAHLITKTWGNKRPRELWFCAAGIIPTHRLILDQGYINHICAIFLVNRNNITLHKSNKLPGSPLLIKIEFPNSTSEGFRLGDTYCPLYCVGHSDEFCRDLGFIDFREELAEGGW
mgnify:CR=1 FL=1